jgi:hypothetical protein
MQELNIKNKVAFSEPFPLSLSVKRDEQQLIFSFLNFSHRFWFQEDINQLYQDVFSLLDDIEIKEVISGADRENIRFSWQINYDFILNFDCYSQSCWLEAENELSQTKISMLYRSFTDASPHCENKNDE